MAIPTYNPEYKALPTYTPQSWNEREIDTLAQKRGATGLRAMRTQIGRVSGLNTGGATSRMTLRDALSGYGSGVSSVMGSANVAAAGEYGNKFAATSGEAHKEYGSKADAANSWNASAADREKTNFGAEMEDWGMAEQNKYATSAREDIARSQKDLLLFQNKLEDDDDWEAKLEKQYKLRKQAEIDSQSLRFQGMKDTYKWNKNKDFSGYKT